MPNLHFLCKKGCRRFICTRCVRAHLKTCTGKYSADTPIYKLIPVTIAHSHATKKASDKIHRKMKILENLIEMNKEIQRMRANKIA